MRRDSPLTCRSLPYNGHGAASGDCAYVGPGHARDEVADDLLLAGMGVGDPYAATAFVRRYQATVFGVALAIAGNELAEDIAQEAFERAWRYAGSYDPRRGTVRSWIMRITRNLAVDAARSRSCTPLAPHDLAPFVAVLKETPERLALARELVTELRSALASLPPPQARAVVMAAVHGLTAREIALIEDVPLGTVKERIHTAMVKLQAALPERVIDE